MLSIVAMRKDRREDSITNCQRTRLLVVAGFPTRRTIVDLLRTVFIATGDALHLWSSSLALDKRRFNVNQGNRFHVDWNGPKLVDSAKCTDTPFVDANEGVSTPAKRAAAQACLHGYPKSRNFMHVHSLSPGRQSSMRRLGDGTEHQRYVQKHFLLQAAFPFPRA